MADLPGKAEAALAGCAVVLVAAAAVVVAEALEVDVLVEVVDEVVDVSVKLVEEDVVDEAVSVVLVPKKTVDFVEGVDRSLGFVMGVPESCSDDVKLVAPEDGVIREKHLPCRWYLGR